MPAKADRSMVNIDQFGIDRDKLEDFSRFEPEFKQHYERQYLDSGYGYSQYRTAYHYGYDLATDARYRGLDWNTMEPQIIRAWDEKRLGRRVRYKEAIRYAWQRMKERKGDAGVTTWFLHQKEKASEFDKLFAEHRTIDPELWE